MAAHLAYCLAMRVICVSYRLAWLLIGNDISGAVMAEKKYNRLA